MLHGQAVRYYKHLLARLSGSSAAEEAHAADGESQNEDDTTTDEIPVDS